MRSSSKKIKEVLKQEREKVEKELSNIAHKTPGEPGGWTSNHPQFNIDGPLDLENETDEVELYVNNLPVEQNLEKKLTAIKEAVKRIDSGDYGLCVKCKNKINPRRLEIMPEADTCMDCQNIRRA